MTSLDKMRSDRENADRLKGKLFGYTSKKTEPSADVRAAKLAIKLAVKNTHTEEEMIETAQRLKMNPESFIASVKILKRIKATSKKD